MRYTRRIWIGNEGFGLELKEKYLKRKSWKRKRK
jgi:hypothetical protein